MRNPLIMLGMNILFLGLFSLGLAQEESITFTTYYPSPYGVYREMRAHRMAIGDTYINYNTVCWDGDTECNTMNERVVVPAATDLLVQGNVGIGTPEPNMKLSVESTANADFTLDVLGDTRLDGRWTGIRFGSAGTGDLKKGGIIFKAIDSWSRGNMHFLLDSAADTGNVTDTDVKMTILGASGNVGIGTTNPDGKLTVEGSVNTGLVQYIRNTNNGETAYAELSVTNSENSAERGMRVLAMGTDWTTSEMFLQDSGVLATDAHLSNGLSIATRAPAPIRFYTGGNHERMRIDEGGNVGIGTTPVTELNIKATDYTNGLGNADLILEGTNTNNPGNVVQWDLVSVGVDGRFEIHDLTSTSPPSPPTGPSPFRIMKATPENTLYLDSTGNVGIGTASPKGKLDVNGTIYQRGVRLHADYVFEPSYELESIEEHSEYMWREKHLKAVPRAKLDENGQEMLEIGAHRRGILEELEKAHVYIEQLDERIKLLEAKL